MDIAKNLEELKIDEKNLQSVAGGAEASGDQKKKKQKENFNTDGKGSYGGVYGDGSGSGGSIFGG